MNKTSLYNIQNIIYPADLLAGGLTTGQAVRLLIAPQQRKKPETEEAAQAKVEENKDKEEGDEDDKKEDDDKLVKDEEPTNIKRNQFNMICYGLPNMMVTQLSKI